MIFFTGYMSGRLVLGRLADRHGAPNTLMVAQLTMAALLLMLVWASGTITTVLLLFLLGIFTRGTSPIIRAMVADSLNEKTSFHDAFSAYSFASRSSSAVPPDLWLSRLVCGDRHRLLCRIGGCGQHALSRGEVPRNRDASQKEAENGDWDSGYR